MSTTILGTPVEKRTLFHFLVPVVMTAVTLLGIQVVWPRDKVEGLAAQQTTTQIGLTDLTYRFERHLVESTAERAEVRRGMTRILILGCLRLTPDTDAYKVAECHLVLGK